MRAWFFGASTPAARLLRLGLLATPLVGASLLGLPICPTAAIFRVPCPGCGLTRATLALAHGDLHLATAFNPIAVVVCPLFVGAFAYAAYRYVRRGNVGADSWGAGPMLVVTMSVLTAIWVMRWFGFFGGPVPVG